MDAFEAKATQDLQTKESELTAPVIERARTAVKEIAKENGYTYVFNSSEGLLLYAEPADDVTELVKTKLGIKRVLKLKINKQKASNRGFFVKVY